MTQKDDIIDEAHVASMLFITARTVRLWRTRRGLPFFKPTHKSILFKRGDVLAWLEKSRVQTMGAA